MEPFERRSQILEKLAFFSSLLTAVLAAVVVLPWAKDAFRSPKESVLLVGGLVSLGLILIARGGRPNPLILSRTEKLIFTTVAISAVAVIASALSFTFRGGHWRAVVPSILYLAAGCGIFLAATSITQNHARLGSWVVVSTASVNAIMAFLQIFGLWSPIVVDPELERTRIAITGLIGNPTDLAAYLVPVCLFSMALGSSSRPTATERWLAWGASSLMLGAIIITESRLALAAVAVGAALIALHRSKRQFAVFCVVLAAIVGLMLAVQPRALDRFRETTSAALEGRFDRFLTGRSIVFQAALLMVRDYPVFGIGPGQFARRYFDYQILATTRNPNLKSSQSSHLMFSEAHSDVLEVASETGVIGVSAMVFAMGALFLEQRRARPQSGRGERTPEGSLRHALLMALTILMVANFPLQLAAVISTFLVVEGWGVAWRKDRELES